MADGADRPRPPANRLARLLGCSHLQSPLCLGSRPGRTSCDQRARPRRKRPSPSRHNGRKPGDSLVTMATCNSSTCPARTRDRTPIRLPGAEPQPACREDPPATRAPDPGNCASGALMTASTRSVGGFEQALVAVEAQRLDAQVRHAGEVARRDQHAHRNPHPTGTGSGRGGTGAECTIEVVVRPCGVNRSRTGSRSSIERRYSLMK